MYCVLCVTGVVEWAANLLLYFPFLSYHLSLLLSLSLSLSLSYSLSHSLSHSLSYSLLLSLTILLTLKMFIGDGAKLVRDAFALAKEKAPTIIFIDELDAVGTKRFDSDTTGDREVQRTMLELLNQLDGFSSDDRIKVIAATNRIDILDPALLRSGRLDRKIEFPHPNEEARARILQIHSRKMNVSSATNFDELARSCEDFNGAQCKAVCVEAGMIALRRGATQIQHEDFMEGIQEVMAKKKTTLQYYA
jgi:26S proteasome regulatory subunit T5